MGFHSSCQRHAITECSNNSPMTIGDRIVKAREARGIKRPELARIADVPYPTLAGLENGDQDSSTKLDIIAGVLRVRPQWLRTGRGVMEAEAEYESATWDDILGYRQSAALGEGAVIDEYAETHKIKFRSDSLRRKRLRPDRLGVCYGEGDSMLPRIKSGDAILFNTDEKEPVDGALFVVSYDGHLLAKQLSQIGGRWFLESLNRDDPKWRKPVPIDEFRHFEIHGRVRWIGSWED